MTEQEPTEEQALREAYGFAVEQLADGVSVQEIQSILVKGGLDEESAAMVASAASREAGTKKMVFGIVQCIAGIVVIAVTYSTVSGGGSSLDRWWGTIIVGGIIFLRGFVYLIRI